MWDGRLRYVMGICCPTFRRMARTSSCCPGATMISMIPSIRFTVLSTAKPSYDSTMKVRKEISRGGSCTKRLVVCIIARTMACPVAWSRCPPLDVASACRNHCVFWEVPRFVAYVTIYVAGFWQLPPRIRYHETCPSGGKTPPRARG
jgi:hypothetical protein